MSPGPSSKRKSAAASMTCTGKQYQGRIQWLDSKLILASENIQHLRKFYALARSRIPKRSPSRSLASTHVPAHTCAQHTHTHTDSCTHAHTLIRAHTDTQKPTHVHSLVAQQINWKPVTRNKEVPAQPHCSATHRASLLIDVVYASP